MKSECSRLEHENRNIKGRVDENKEKIKLNKQLPYLVSNVIEILDLSDEEEDDEI